MKKYLFILAALLILGCDNLSLNDSIGNFEVKTLETVSDDEWGSDLLYKALPNEHYQFSSLEEAKKRLTSMQGKGVSLEAAWFRDGSPTCGQLQVVVPTTLVIQLSEQTDIAKLNEAFDYVGKNEPILLCPTNVKKLVPR